MAETRLTVAITGANGSVGKALLGHVARQRDVAAIACVRSEQAVAALPASPAITPRVVAYGDVDRLASVLTGAGCVVHLAGILLERGTSTYQGANVDATRAVVEACRPAGVSHIVLVSVLGADHESANRFWHSKGRAERIVAESGLSATIIRTPMLLGPETAGARALVHAASQGSVRLLGGGRHSLRPLDVDDLSRAILYACRHPARGVVVHELVGPEPTTYRDLVARMGGLMGNQVSVSPMPIGLAKLGAAMAGWTRRGGMTPTVIDVITSDERVDRNADADLGVGLTPLSATLENLLKPERTADDQ